MSEVNRLDSLNEEVQGLNELLEVAQLVVSSIEMDHVLYAILESALRLTKSKAGSVALYDKCTKELWITAHRGFSERFVANRHWKVRPDGLTARILSSSEPTVINDTTNKEFFSNPHAIEEGIKSMVCIPLKLEEEVTGILYVDDFNPREYTKTELRLLFILSSFAAMSIDHATKLANIKKLAITDGLTGLYNHRYFQETLERELSRAVRYDEELSLLMMDIDDFKKVNDTFGHQLGDSVLIMLSECLMASTRESDFAARYGGEEFALILPNTDPKHALEMAKRIRKNSSTLSKKLVKGRSPVTISIGISSFPSDGKSREELIGTADAALYRAKKNGKDQAVPYALIKESEVG